MKVDNNRCQCIPGGNMIISDERRFIFVHVEKTGGTSIGQVLLPFAIPQPRSRLHAAAVWWLRGRDYRHYRYRTHATLADAQSRMPSTRYREYFKFAFVRNPWDRLVSEYNAALSKARKPRHRRIASLGGFPAYVQYEIRRGKFFQYPKICGLDGLPGLDFVGRFESLEKDFGRVCQTLGIDAKLDRLNAYSHVGYREYYDDETRERVARHWHREIEQFGYAF